MYVSQIVQGLPSFIQINSQGTSFLYPIVLDVNHYYGSFWGSYNDLREVVELAKKGLIKHQIQKFGLSKANDALDQLREGKILGRGDEGF
jgi:D-arabinose 1-dehydrogenase-like Zn-dependent alcohol dehydrogenase